ncbi:MAG: LAGLIDADG family homing endonuclease [Candidatus Heimdallarchaeota archaeon]
MKYYDEEKPIYQLGLHAKNTMGKKKSKQVRSDNVLEWSQEKQLAYLRGIYDSRGNIFTSESGQMIISINHNNPAKMEIIQKILEINGIHSLIYNPLQYNENLQLIIIGKMALKKFEEKIGLDESENTNTLLTFMNQNDWED